MLREEKERIVAELVERLRTSEILIIADYRGLGVREIDGVRSELLQHGARFSVVKNTLTKLAADAAGVGALNEFLEGPTAIAFVSGGDMVAVAKALNETARRTRVLALKGGILDGRSVTADQVRELATLPPEDVLRAHVLGAVVGPLNAIAGLFAAPLRDFVGVIEARTRQLEEQAPSAPAAEEPVAARAGAEAEETEGEQAPPDEPQAEAPGSAEDPQTPTADATESAAASAEEVQSAGEEREETEEG